MLMALHGLFTTRASVEPTDLSIINFLSSLHRYASDRVAGLGFRFSRFFRSSQLRRFLSEKVKQETDLGGAFATPAI